MRKYTRYVAPLAFGLTLALGACKKADDAADSSLNRDLAMAGSDTMAQPALTDTATHAAPAPARTTTRSSSSSSSTKSTTPSRTTSGNTVTTGTKGTESTGMLAAGTTVNLRSDQRICTNTNKVGDRFTATVADPVVASNGATIPAGATANVVVTQLKRSENTNDAVVFGVDVTSITFGGKTYPVEATTTYANVDKVRSTTRGTDAKKVAAGAAIGAIAGQVLGKNTKSTVIGGAIGAAAGAGAAAATANYEGCLGQTGRMVIKLDAPLTITKS